VWQRNAVLAELQKNDPQVAEGVFWRIWPVYVRFVCPIIIAIIFYRSLV
jgi:NSS family neurotransmitter:Na+ symporter